MADPHSVSRNGNELLILMDDGTKHRALQLPSDMWLVGGKPDPVNPDPPPPTGARFDWPFDSRPYDQGGTVIYEYGPRWGRLHAGMDMAHREASNGAIIKAASSGTVWKVATTGNHGGYGNVVILDHGQGLFTLYAHMQNGSFMVSQGQTVTKGQGLGRVGSTGQSQGPHLHFETHEGGYNWYASSRNPRTFFAKWNG